MPVEFPANVPKLELGREDIANLLLASVALEEMSLASILSFGEGKLKAALTESGGDARELCRSLEKSIYSISQMQMMLSFKIENFKKLAALLDSAEEAAAAAEAPAAAAREEPVRTASETQPAEEDQPPQPPQEEVLQDTYGEAGQEETAEGSQEIPEVKEQDEEEAEEEAAEVEAAEDTAGEEEELEEEAAEEENIEEEAVKEASIQEEGAEVESIEEEVVEEEPAEEAAAGEESGEEPGAFPFEEAAEPVTEPEEQTAEPEELDEEEAVVEAAEEESGEREAEPAEAGQQEQEPSPEEAAEPQEPQDLPLEVTAEKEEEPEKNAREEPAPAPLTLRSGKLTGTGEGYMFDQGDASRRGVASIKANLSLTGEFASNSGLKYTARFPSDRGMGPLTLLTLPQSVTVELLSPPVESPTPERPNEFLIRGQGISGRYGNVEELLRNPADFVLTIMDYGRYKRFRMEIASANPSLCHDSGLVQVLVGNLQVSWEI